LTRRAPFSYRALFATSLMKTIRSSRYLASVAE